MRRALLFAVLTAVSSCAPVPAQAHHVREGDVRAKVTCNWSHTLADDPIVHPGEPGASHSHEFFGNTTTDAFSTTASLAAAPTTCNNPADHAGYWQPTLLEDGQRVQPSRMTAYYRLGGKDGWIYPLPTGLRIVSDHSNWQCNDAPVATPDGCVGRLTLRITFPDCWAAWHLDSPDHRSHMAYSTDAGPANVCPDAFPGQEPALSTYTSFPTHGGTVTLSSGGPETAHGDFVDAWDQPEMNRLVNDCLNAYQHCDSGA